MGKFSDEHVLIPKKDIESFKAKRGLVQYKIERNIREEKKMVFKANKILGRAKWQKNNHRVLESNNWFRD